MYYLLKETIEPCDAAAVHGAPCQYAAVLTPEQWQTERESFDMGIELEPDAKDIHATKAEVNYDSLTGTFLIPDREDLTERQFKFAFALDEKGIVSSEIYQKLLFGKLEVNEGMFIENIVAQMLTASGNKLFFYSKSSEEAEERMEIDFLLQKDKVTSRHNIRPIEVKSGKNYTLSSLTKCMNKFGEYMTTPTVLHAADYKVVDGITYLPLYMTPLL